MKIIERNIVVRLDLALTHVLRLTMPVAFQ